MTLPDLPCTAAAFAAVGIDMLRAEDFDAKEYVDLA